MKKKRLIPVLLLRNGWLVQSKEFRCYQNIGNPTGSVKRFSEWTQNAGVRARGGRARASHSGQGVDGHTVPDQT
jgi:hypothetical protein